MRLILLLLLFTNPVKDINKVAEVNALKKDAKEAYTQGRFDEAIKNYERLTNEFGITDENVMLNMANAYFKNDANEEALALYNGLSQSDNKSIRSTAYNQMGVLANQNQKKEEAINYFKEAIRADPSNEAARFNYSKLKQEKEEQQQQDQDENNKDQNQDQDQNEKNKDQQNKDKDQEQQDKENQEQEDKSDEGEKGDEENEEQQNDQQDQEGQDADQKSRAEKLEEMNMSEEKAQMILEAMKNNEVQYIQQNKKKPQSRVDDGRPDW